MVALWWSPNQILFFLKFVNIEENAKLSPETFQVWCLHINGYYTIIGWKLKYVKTSSQFYMCIYFILYVVNNNKGNVSDTVKIEKINM